jgi:hypothetical protein
MHRAEEPSLFRKVILCDLKKRLIKEQKRPIKEQKRPKNRPIKKQKRHLFRKVILCNPNGGRWPCARNTCA